MFDKIFSSFCFSAAFNDSIPYQENILSSAEKEYASGISHPQTKQNWITGRFLVKQLLSQKYGGTLEPCSCLTIHSKDKMGRGCKPYLIDSRACYLPYIFSISHAENAVAVAVSNIPNSEIGIDITQLGSVSPVVQRQYFTESEIQLLQQCPAMSFLPELIWASKEAAFKANIDSNKVPFRPKEYLVKVKVPETIQSAKSDDFENSDKFKNAFTVQFLMENGKRKKTPLRWYRWEDFIIVVVYTDYTMNT